MKSLDGYNFTNITFPPISDATSSVIWSSCPRVETSSSTVMSAPAKPTWRSLWPPRPVSREWLRGSSPPPASSPTYDEPLTRADSIRNWPFWVRTHY